jgi:hypothetical protein
VERKGAPAARVGSGERELELGAVPAVEQQGSFERELVEGVELDVSGSREGKLQVGGARKNQLTVDDVTREPRLGFGRQARSKEQRVVLGSCDEGAEQRVFGGGEACVGEARAGGWSGIDPEALSLKGVGG